MFGTPFDTVTGYTHSDGYCLCPEHANYGSLKDAGNETGKVYPIFISDEWDTQPTCDIDGCDEEIEVTLIGQEETDTRYEIVGIDAWENVDLDELALLGGTETSDSTIYCLDCSGSYTFEGYTTRRIPRYEASDEGYICKDCVRLLSELKGDDE